MGEVVELADAKLGYKLLELLGIAGWTVDVQPRFGGGVIVHALKEGLVIRQDGGSVAEIAPQLFDDAVEAYRKLRRWQQVVITS